MPSKATRLRVIDTPEAKAAFEPLWEQRNAVMEEQGTVTEAMFAAINRGDKAAETIHRDKLDALKLEEERLSGLMRPHQSQNPSEE